MTNKLDTRFTGVLPVRQFAVLFHDELYQMINRDPKTILVPSEVEKAMQCYDVIMQWSPTERTKHYLWLRSNL